MKKSVGKEYPPSLAGKKLYKIIFLGLAKDPTEVWLDHGPEQKDNIENWVSKSTKKLIICLPIFKIIQGYSSWTDELET